MQDVAQWYFSLIVYHGPRFGHRIEFTTKSRGREEFITPGGQWTGLGIPGEVLNSVRAAVDAIVTQHLVTRYGVQDELPFGWAGDAEPF